MLRNDSVVVRVNGVDRITLTGLTGATSTNPRYLRFGVDNYAGTQTGQKKVFHDQVGVTSRGWLGQRSAPGPSSPITYLHDDLGRLSSVIDPDGDTGSYSYDPAGNLLSIGRASSYAVTLKEFSPKRGVVGDTVTVYGTGFSATPASNVVKFGTVTATVTAATRSKLTVTVPPTAATGTISVTTSGTTATSIGSFTVGATTPTISAVSVAKGDADQTFTITGTRFETTPTNNNVTVNGTFAQVTAATATLLTVKIPPGTGSGPVAVATPGGRVVASADLYLTPYDNPQVVPTGWTAANMGYTGRVALGGSILATQSAANAGKFGLVIFSATKGKRVAIKATAGPFAQTSLIDPNGDWVGGSFLRATMQSGGGGFIDTLDIPITGTYALYLYANTPATGSQTFTVYDVPADISAQATIGGAGVTVSTTAPGQKALVTFSGTQGQKVSLKNTPISGQLGLMTIKTPTSSVLLTSGANFIEPFTLPQTGTYTILVSASAESLASTTVQLFGVPADTTGTIATDGTPTTTSNTVPGQNIALSFSGCLANE